MSMNFRTLAAFCALSLSVTGSLTGCGKNPGGSESASSPLLSGSGAEQTSDVGGAYDIDLSEPASADCTIEFSSEKITISGNGASELNRVVTISKAGVYSLSGSGSGSILVEAGKQDKVTLLLNGLALKSESGSVIDCESAKTLVLYLCEDTQNELADSADYSFSDGDSEPDSAVFSRGDTVIMGGGALTVNGCHNNAIKSKDGLAVSEGTLSVIAADDGIIGKDYVDISGGEITINAGGDGIKSTNDKDAGRGYISVSGGSLNISCGNDGIQAENELSVSGGKIVVLAGGDEALAEVKASASPFDRDNRFSRAAVTASSGAANSESKKGLKAGSDIAISGGDIEITSADDSVHSNASVTVSNGNLKLSSCDDGIHADKNLCIKGGTIAVTKSYEGLEGENIEISGGNIDVKAADDGLNAAGGDNGSFFGFDSTNNDYYISISGGNITVNADGDGIDSNGTIAMSGGVTVVYGPADSANGAIDYERSFAVSGGTLIALGSDGMAQAPSTLSQPCLSIYANVSAGSSVEVRDIEGNVILSAETPKNCRSLIFTCEQLKSGETYNIYSGETLLSTVIATDGVSGGGASGNGFGGMGGERGGMGRPGDFLDQSGQGGWDGQKPDRFGGRGGQERLE